MDKRYIIGIGRENADTLTFHYLSVYGADPNTAQVVRHVDAFSHIAKEQYRYMVPEHPVTITTNESDYVDLVISNVNTGYYGLDDPFMAATKGDSQNFWKHLKRM